MSDVPPTEFGPIRAGDNGTVIEFIVTERQRDGSIALVDLSAATGAMFTFERPDGTTFTRAATIVPAVGGLPLINGRLRYLTIPADFPVAGRYPIQAQVTFDSTHDWFTSLAILLVDRSL